MIKASSPLPLTHMTEFLKFGLVGTLGFVVDASVLYACMHFLGLGPYSGRALSFVTAVLVTWFCNRHFTFKDKKGNHAASTQLGKFFVSCLGGFVFNYGTYALLITHSDLIHTYPIIGVAIGSIAGLFFNFGASKYVVFR